MKKTFYFYLKIILSLSFLFLGSILGYGWYKSHSNPYPIDHSQIIVPKVKEIPLPFTHQYNPEDLPTIGSALFDLDNDGKKELFLGGGRGQSDGLFTYQDETFLDISEGSHIDKKENQSTYAAAALDLTNDGYTDLLLSRNDGVYLLENKQDRSFHTTKTNIELNKKTAPLSLALTDLNHDGWADVFVSGYIKKEFVEGYTIFNDDTYGGSSQLFLNNGDNTFRDITKEAGLDYVHNTFVALFVDIDDDLDQDLVVAYDTGQPKVYKNNGDITFSLLDTPHKDEFSYPMGIAVGDINNDLLPDFLFSNVGNTVPTFFARGDLTEEQVLHEPIMLFENQGNGVFKDTAQEKKVAGYEFSWGATMADLNLDSKEDIIITESYIDFPFHKWFKLPGRVLLQNPNGTFVSAEKEMGATNRAYGIAPLIGDFDNDGDEDLIHVNLDGASLACLNTLQEKQFIKVILPETPKSLGTKVVLTHTNGEQQAQFFISGEGLVSEQSHDLIFGIAPNTTPLKIELFYPNGETKTLHNLEVNQNIIVDESQ